MKERRHKIDPEILKRVRALRLIDDDFMKACFVGSPKCVEYVLRIIMDVPTLKVKKLSVPLRRANIRGHGVEFDVFAVDETGKAYDIEVQRSDKGAGCRRARFYSAALDFGLLRKGEEYESLPESFVLFITENDVVGGNKPLYHVNRHIEEMEMGAFGDGSHIIYVNGKWRGKDAVGSLMRDFFCADPERISAPVLRERAKYLKGTEKGDGAMCKAMEEIEAIGEARGERKGRREGRLESMLATAKRLLANGKLMLKEIAECSGLSLAQVKKLQASMAN